MHLTQSQVQTMTEDTLLRFLELKIPEGHSIDYKAELSGDNWEKQAREFLKDVTAFANASGGHLFIGVREPTDDGNAKDQITGIEAAEDTVHKLESVAAANIDPRIPGILIRSVALAMGKYVIIVHVSPSLSRPHMVQYKKERTFYVRHSESSSPMTTHEIRESVIASASAEAKARQYLEQQMEECKRYGLAARGNPTLLVQAMPLIPLESDWNILGGDFKDILQQGGQSSHGRHLESMIRPTPTIYGIIGRDSREQPKWISHIHRNGYVAVEFIVREGRTEGTAGKYILSNANCVLFADFADLCEKLLVFTETDRPYLIQCTGMNMTGVILFTDETWNEYSDPYPRNDLVWPAQIRSLGERFQDIADRLCVLLWNAFGYEKY